MLQGGLNNSVPVQILSNPVSRMRTKLHEKTRDSKGQAANHESPHEIDGPRRPTVVRSYFVIVAVIERATLK